MERPTAAAVVVVGGEVDDIVGDGDLAAPGSSALRASAAEKSRSMPRDAAAVGVDEAGSGGVVAGEMDLVKTGGGGTGGGAITGTPPFLLDDVGDGVAGDAALGTPGAVGSASWGTAADAADEDEDARCSRNLSKRRRMFVGIETRGEGAGDGGVGVPEIVIRGVSV